MNFNFNKTYLKPYNSEIHNWNKRIIFLFVLLCLSNLLFAQPSGKESFTLSDTIIKIEANPELGFNYPYLLRIPKGLNQNKSQYLLVETNNTGDIKDSLSFHEKAAYFQITQKSIGIGICQELKTPFLIPVFPRPEKEWNIYTHMLDRDAIMLKKGEMKRLDLQLIAMVENAKTVLKKFQIMTKDKFFMTGFSSSGNFANRFTLIHPNLIAGTATGGINSIPILCAEKLDGQELDYPIGTHDFEMLFGSKFSLDEFKKVPQFIYMGQNDTNDAVLFDDGYSLSERDIIFKVLGKKMIPDRFKTCESVFKQNKVNCIFKVYPNLGHEINEKVYDDVLGFFSKIQNLK
jgi:predicted esterase